MDEDVTVTARVAINDELRGAGWYRCSNEGRGHDSGFLVGAGGRFNQGHCQRWIRLPVFHWPRWSKTLYHQYHLTLRRN